MITKTVTLRVDVQCDRCGFTKRAEWVGPNDRYGLAVRDKTVTEAWLGFHEAKVGHTTIHVCGDCAALLLQVAAPIEKGHTA